MLQFKIPTYAFYGCRGNFLSPEHRVKLGDTNLHQSKLILPALHLTTLAAQRLQPFAHRPIVTHTFAPNMLTCQFAAAQLLVVKTPVSARSATFFNHDAKLIGTHFEIFCLSFHRCKDRYYFVATKEHFVMCCIGCCI